MGRHGANLLFIESYFGLVYDDRLPNLLARLHDHSAGLAGGGSPQLGSDTGQ